MFHPKKFFKKIGPGVITGASDDDPSGIATYSQAGARFGYSLLWMAFFTTPLMMAVQEMSARLGLVTGRGLADILRRHSSVNVVLVLSSLLFVVNTVNIGADLGAMTEALRLVLPGPGWLYLLLIAGLIIVLEVFLSYKKYVNVLRWLTIALISYVAASFFTHPNWLSVLKHTVLPVVSSGKDFWFMMVAVLGTTISPYLFFWQASEEVEDHMVKGKPERAQDKLALEHDLKTMRSDVWVGMVFSNLIMFFIMLTAAGTLYEAGLTHVDSAAQAAAVLRPLPGNAAFLLFALGIVGAGLLAVPVLATSASYALAEVFGWREGLSQTFRQARGFYTTIVAAIVLGALINFIGISPIRFLIFSAVLNGLLAPVILWFIVRLADQRHVVGDYISQPWIRFCGWLTFALMAIAGFVVLVQALFS